jgi:hypothetical protein
MKEEKGREQRNREKRIAFERKQRRETKKRSFDERSQIRKETKG